MSTSGTVPGLQFVRATITPATPGLNNGVPIYTPPVIGTYIVDGWYSVPEAWDGLQPTLDIGTFTGTVDGLYQDDYTPRLSIADERSSDPTLVEAQNAPIYFTTLNPLLAVVSQNGQLGASACGSTVGVAVITLLIHVPS